MGWLVSVARLTWDQANVVLGSVCLWCIAYNPSRVRHMHSSRSTSDGHGTNSTTWPDRDVNTAKSSRNSTIMPLVPFPDGLVDTGKSPPNSDSRLRGNDGQVKRVSGIRHIQVETALVSAEVVIRGLQLDGSINLEGGQCQATLDFNNPHFHVADELLLLCKLVGVGVLKLRPGDVPQP